jgi:ATP-binding cassette, subfamily C (CFTR/MRP), member 1
MKFCDSPIWNESVIYDDPPDLTKCFQNSFLFWIPCFMLWILAPAWIRMVSKTRPVKLRFSSLTFSKIVINYNIKHNISLRRFFNL